MTDNRSLLDRLAELDPVSPERISEVAGDADRLREEILATEVDQLAARRRMRGRRIASLAAAAIVAVALIVPLAILLSLAGNDDRDPNGPAGDPPVTSSETIDVLAPAPGDRVASPATVRGTADVFEATVSIRILDATNNVIADTFTTATCGSGCRGDFEAEVPFSVGTEQPGVVQVFEVSAEDGSELHMVRIPVTLLPEAPDRIASEVEQAWYADGRPVPAGEGTQPLELHVFPGLDHCGWTSVSFLHVAWPLGAQAGPGDPWRQYLRDPHGLLADDVAVPFDPDATLPSDAERSSYSSGAGWSLWITPSDDDQAVYLVAPDRGIVERWARAVPDPILCR